VCAVESQRAPGRRTTVGHAPPALHLFDCVIPNRPVGPHRAVNAVAADTVDSAVSAAAFRLFGV